MSIRYGLLALLGQQPMYGYQLRTRFEARTGGAWPLNVGQVYTTLDRLERDGLVRRAGDDGEGRTTYAITEQGRDALRRWFTTPVDPSGRPRDELAIKLAMAVTVAGVDVRAVVQAQRTESMRVLRDYTRLKRRAAQDEDLSWGLVVDHLVFAVEAEIRWLDHVEGTLARHRAPEQPEPDAPAGRGPDGPGRADAEQVTTHE